MKIRDRIRITDVTEMSCLSTSDAGKSCWKKDFKGVVLVGLSTGDLECQKEVRVDPK